MPLYLCDVISDFRQKPQLDIVNSPFGYHRPGFSEVLIQIEGVEPHYQIIVDRIGNLDELSIQVEMNERLISDEIKELETREQQIRSEIESMLGIKVGVHLVEPKTIVRSEGKAKRVIDRRTL